MSKNYYVVKDTYLQVLNWFDMTGHWYTIGVQLNKDKVGFSRPNKLFINKFWLTGAIVINKRQIFGWFDLLGKLGGITNVMMLLFGFFLFGISEHSFTLKAAKKLFIARTRDEKLFLKDPRNDVHVKALSHKAKGELDIHRAIKFSRRDSICLYFSNHMGCCFPSFLFPNKAKF